MGRIFKRAVDGTLNAVTWPVRHGAAALVEASADIHEAVEDPNLPVRRVDGLPSPVERAQRLRAGFGSSEPQDTIRSNGPQERVQVQTLG